MTDYSKITKQTLLKNIVGKAIYEVNSRSVTFKIVYFDGGVPYGYCHSRRWWAHLYPNYIETDRGEIIVATRISLENY